MRITTGVIRKGASVRSTHGDTKEYLKSYSIGHLILFECAKENFVHCIYSIELYPFVIESILEEFHLRLLVVSECHVHDRMMPFIDQNCFVMIVVEQED